MLRTACATTFAGSGPRVLMVTSAQPLEGKTTTSCNLALALAYGGARVLLIDADLRRPNLHRVLDVPNERGLADLLSGTVKPREATQQTETRNLVVMTSGRVPPNPSELLASARMRTLLSHLREGPFDWIIIDTPPVLAVTDSMVVAPLADGVLLVIGSEMTRRSLAQRAIESLSQSRPGPMAAVLNKVDLTRDKYYYSKRYGYETTSYYAEAL
jgi:capsular exopolysaccharide synthesis family protein